jgi:hypothetical protein
MPALNIHGLCSNSVTFILFHFSSTFSLAFFNDLYCTSHVKIMSFSYMVLVEMFNQTDPHKNHDHSNTVTNLLYIHQEAWCDPINRSYVCSSTLAAICLWAIFFWTCRRITYCCIKQKKKGANVLEQKIPYTHQQTQPCMHTGTPHITTTKVGARSYITTDRVPSDHTTTT